MSVAGSKSGLRYSPNAITCAEVNRDMLQVEVRTRAPSTRHIHVTQTSTNHVEGHVCTTSHRTDLMAGEDDNLSFVLNAIQDVSFQQRPIPKARE